jgi:ABC-type amino acid transport substrate-binding protein
MSVLSRVRIKRPFHYWRKRWVWLFPVVGIALLLVLWGLGRGLGVGRDVVWARIQRSGVWRVGMDPSLPPFEELDPATGQPVGLDVELVRAIADRWGVRAEIVGVGFDQLVDAVAAHRVDSAVSGLPVFPYRAREVSFSQPYVEAGVVLAVPQGSPIRSTDDLAGRRVAAEWGSEGDAQARALQRRLNGKLELLLRESPDAALAAVIAGEADAAAVDAVSLALFDQVGELVIVGEPLYSNPYVIVVPANAPRLLAAVNQALADLTRDGTLAELKRRWLGPQAR